MINVLLTNSGRRDYFVDYLNEIKFSKIRIFCTDTNKNVPTISKKKIFKYFITKEALKFPKVYKKQIKNIVNKYKIDLVIPLSDYDLKILADLKDEKKNGKNKSFFLVSDKKIIDICISKKKSFIFLNENNFFSPNIYKSVKEIKKFPVVIKEDYGNGSKNLKIITNKNELPNKISSKMIIQEHIQGKEYNIDILNNFRRKFVSCSSKLKLIMRAGETDRCKIVANKKLFDFSIQLSKCLKHIGNLDVDVIIRRRKIFIIDVNPRFGGGYPFTHVSGLNYISYIISLLNNKKPKIKNYNDYELFMNKGISVYAQK